MKENCILTSISYTACNCSSFCNFAQGNFFLIQPGVQVQSNTESIDSRQLRTSMMSQNIICALDQSAMFCIILLHFSNDVLSVCVLPQHRNMWSDLCHENLSLARFRNINHFLDDVVCELVSHHCAQGTVCTFAVQDLFNQHRPFWSRCVNDTFLDNIAREFVLSKQHHFASQFLDNFAFVFSSSVLQDVLKQKCMILLRTHTHQSDFECNRNKVKKTCNQHNTFSKRVKETDMTFV